MVVQGQLVEPAVIFSEKCEACEERIYSFIGQKSNNIRLRQQMFLISMIKKKHFNL